MNWTEEQKLAIEESGTNIIVSAGAGSGKTAVLAARVLKKLQEGVDIRNILILTFTNEAAGEMKKRIREGMIKNNISLGLEYIDAAYITTFDAYALNLVKKYHYLLNINRDCTIIDSSLIELKKAEVLEDIFAKYYEIKDSRFLKLIGDFTERDDAKIKKAILNINRSLDLKYDKRAYLESYLDTFYTDAYITKITDEYFSYLQELCEKLENDFNILEDFLTEKQALSFREALKNYINPKDYNTLYESKTKLPIVRNLDEEAKKIKDDLKANFDLINEGTVYSLEELKEQINLTKDYVSIIIDILLELDSKINAYKRREGTFEFVDIAKMAIEIVEENEDIREELKISFHEIMIDEYQDTNDLQELFIKNIENNNVYMVGDIKQSIYRFRNANPNIFKEKYENYRKNLGGVAIDLVKNFRSREEVLIGINKIFNLLMTQEIGDVSYKKGQAMVFGNKAYLNNTIPDYNYNLKILKYPNDLKEYSKVEVEAFAIARDILKKLNDGYQVYDFDLKDKRDAEYKDFCIILDRGTDMPLYKQIFEYLNIPMEVYQDGNLTSDKEILIIKNIVSLVVAIHEKDYSHIRYYFTSIARSFIGTLSDEEILEVIHENKILETEICKKCFKLSNNLETKTPNLLLKEILDEFNFLEKLITVGGIEEALIRLDYLLDLTENMEKLGFTVKDLASVLEEILENKMEIRYKEPKKDTNCVKIMNIHKSKGLEFPVCYYAGLYKKFNLMEIKDRFLFDNTYGILTPFYKEGIGTLITKTLIRNKYLKDEISEKVRLFYVALTRAKEEMIMILPEFESVGQIKNEVDLMTGLAYRSFYDFLNSMSVNLGENIHSINLEDLGLSHNYIRAKKQENFDTSNDNRKIVFKENNLEFKEIEERHASKQIKELLTKETKKTLEYGTEMHEMLEKTDFKNYEGTNSTVLKLLETFDFKGANIYQELEFIFSDEGAEYHGIIDLMLEFPDKIQIIDYKLKNVEDENYKKQLEVYEKYIHCISSKPVELYLYSIIDEKVKRLDGNYTQNA